MSVAVGTAREDLKSVNKPRHTCQRCSIARGGARKAQGPNRHVSHACTHAHMQSNANSMRTPTNASVMSDLPARDAEPHVGKLERLKSHTDTLDTCTCMQGIENNASMSEHHKTAGQSQTHLVQAKIMQG